MLFVAMPLAVAIVFAVAIYRARRGTRRALLTELGLLTAGFFVYFGVRAVTEGSPEAAMANADRIISVQRALGIYVEPSLNAIAAERPWLTTLMNWVYIWGHWPFIALVAIWLHRARPAAYRLTRNAFFVSGLIGFLFFALLPTAPPRLAHAADFVDTVTESSNSYRVLQPPTVTNQYAAFPSLHFGWNLLIGIALVRYARRPVVRALGAATPVAMLAATVFTANHYLLDLAVGGAVALVGLLVAAELARRRETPAPPAQRQAPAAGIGPRPGHAAVLSPLGPRRTEVAILLVGVAPERSVGPIRVLGPGIRPAGTEHWPSEQDPCCSAPTGPA